jgi:UDP:flavonoid glycosyltransferase YjiC (YdhE family)
VSRVVLAGLGTRGDVVPLTGIGVRLRAAGHDVVVAAPSLYADLILGCGLDHRPMDADLGIDADLADADPLRLVRAIYAPSGIRAMGDGVLAALRDEPADVLLLSPLTEFAGHQLAEARGIPSIGVRLQPLSTTAAYPPAVLGAWSLGSVGNRAAGALGTALLDRGYAGPVAGFRAELGLPRVSARALRRRRTAAGWPILYGFSPSVVARPPDWRPGLDVVGYWWPPRPVDWRPPAELTRFLAAGPAPVFVGFGSLVTGRAAAERLSTLVLRALRAAGVRGVLQAGWAGLAASGDDVLTIGDVPHDWLFDRVAAVAHACGAGTTAAGLRAGVPAVAVPSGAGDQPFWARRLRELGVSAATLAQRTLTEQALTTAIRTALTDDTLLANARRLAARIAAEDGAGRVLAAVERIGALA